MNTSLAVRRCAVSLTAALAVLAGTAPASSAAPRTPVATVRQHAIPFTEATVTERGDGTYTLAWRAPGAHPVTVYADGRPVARGGAEQTVTVGGLPAADRRWFRLVPDKGGALTLADRSLHLAAATNFRDAGGYRTSDGRWVRMGAVYRTGEVAKLTDADLAALERLGMRTDYDLRMKDERAKAPDRLPQGTRYVVADVVDDEDPSGNQPTTPEAMAAAMDEAYRSYIWKPSARKAYGALLRDAAKPGSHGLFFHCTAGKDRTGWANAVLLTALGVDRATVMRDYLATNDYRAKENKEILDSLPPDVAALVTPALEARPAYLNAAFDEVEARYGSFDAYVRDGLGLTGQELDELRRNLLTD
ncbi:tyrosine-protein phosphatase [Streptomyces cinnamoneus]|uniref:tyrosine-protein phosphatase n=1 Tax=Streptomyces cinnamoneus TaxID=53446 RepID=UPI0037A12308